MESVLQQCANTVEMLSSVDVATLGPLGLRRLIEGVQRHLDQVQVLQARWLQRAQDSGAHLGTGARSMSGWLAAQTGAAYGDTVNKIRLADTLGRSPELADAVQSGEVSPATATALFKAVVDAPDGEALSDLVDRVTGLDPTAARTQVEQWRLERCTESPEQREYRNYQARSFTYGPVEDGMISGSWRLPVLAAREVIATVSYLGGKPSSTDDRSTEQRLADGLVQLCAAYGRGEITGGHERPTVLVTVTAESLTGQSNAPALTAHGDPVSAHVIRHLAEDAVLRRVLTNGTEILDQGRSERFATLAQFRALVARDGGCRWPGCDIPAAWCDVDHLTPWTDGGTSDLSNLVLWCRHHHTEKHRPGVRVRGDAHELVLELPEFPGMPGGAVLECPPRGVATRTGSATKRRTPAAA
ncbi:MAG: hypothetical protein RL219_1088 [Actinomycetota bacterium]